MPTERAHDHMDVHSSVADLEALAFTGGGIEAPHAPTRGTNGSARLQALRNDAFKRAAQRAQGSRPKPEPVYEPEPEREDVEDMTGMPDAHLMPFASPGFVPSLPPPEFTPTPVARPLVEAPLAARPRPQAAPQAAPAPTDLYARRPTVLDGDLLWDLLRIDREGVIAFLGLAPQSSVEMHQTLAQFSQAEGQGTGMLRTVIRAGQVVGFAALSPIDVASRLAHVHLYLVPTVRGELSALLPTLIEMAMQAAPGLQLFLQSARPEWSRILAPYGFTDQHVLSGPRPS